MIVVATPSAHWEKRAPAIVFRPAMRRPLPVDAWRRIHKLHTLQLLACQGEVRPILSRAAAQATCSRTVPGQKMWRPLARSLGLLRRPRRARRALLPLLARAQGSRDLQALQALPGRGDL